jgi:putative ABC transport system permease protein
MIGPTLGMALRAIRRNTMRSFLTTLGVVIGVASVIGMISLGRAASAKVTEEISAMGTNLVFVVPGSSHRTPTAENAPAFRIEDAAALLREASAVRTVAASASRTALVVYGDRNWNTSVIGSTPEFFEIRGYTFAEGEPFSERDVSAGASVCVLGDSAGRQLFGSRSVVGETMRIGQVSCRVTGRTRPKGQAAFGADPNDFVVMPLSAYQRRVAGNGDVNAIFVTAVSDKETQRAKEQIASIIRERRHIGQGQSDDFEVQDMKEITRTLGGVTGALTGMLGVLAGISLLVGGIGIMNIMLVSVTERTREIGLRLAIGARGREVLMQFLLEAIALSTLGGVLGMAVGLGGSYAAARTIGLPFKVAADTILLALGFSGSVGVTFGFLPARRAARLNPIEALRHE